MVQVTIWMLFGDAKASLAKLVAEVGNNRRVTEAPGPSGAHNCLTHSGVGMHVGITPIAMTTVRNMEPTSVTGTASIQRT
jgi:hypothetical protein